MKPETALKKAIKAAGGYSALGRLFNIHRQAVAQWKKVPAERVIALEKATGGTISRYDLRPDIYPDKPTGSA